MKISRTALVVLMLVGSGPGIGGPAAAAPAGAAVQPREQPARADPRVDLRPRFKPGQQIRYVMNIDSATDVTSAQMPELDQKQSLRQEITVLLRVVETGSEGSTVEMVYERVKVDLESEAMNASYDSARPASKAPAASPREKRREEKPRQEPARDPDAEPGEGGAPSIPALDMTDNEMLAAAMQGIAGTVVTIDLDAAGNITGVRGTESLSGGGSLGGIPGVGGAGAGVPAPSAGGGGPWSISSPGQSGFASVGESWSTTSALGGTPLGTFQMVTRYTLRSASGGRATIAINGGIEGGTAAPSAPGGGGAQVREARYSGQCIWDTSEGQLREMTTTQSATVEGSGLGVPVVMKSSTDMKVRRR